MSNDEEIYEIKGDVADPGGTGRRGISVGADLTKSAIGHPRIRFRDRISEADLYAADGELMVHMYCPQCQNANQILGSRKRIEWSGDRITIEVFTCTWPGCGLRMDVKDNVGREVN